MKRHRNTRAWLLSFLKAGELATLFLLPFTLVATAPPDQSPAAPPADPPAPPNPNAYEPEVVDLIETTYLGRGKEFPDPEEPTVVLKKYLEQNAHGYHAQLTQQEQKLDAELAEWQALTRQYP